MHNQLSALLKDIDRPTPNVRLEVDMNEAGSTIDRGLALKGRGKVIVTGKGSKTHYKFTSEARNRSTKISSNTKQILLVQSGREGQLNIGEEIPYADWLFYYGRSHGYIDQDFQFDRERTGVFLTASPKVIGNGPMISITLTPEIRTLVGKKYKRFRFIRAATTITAHDGQPITIGGSSQNREFYEKFLVGFSNNGSIKSLNITLTPFIKYPDGK
jgi:type II secretory pathway component GspD/PulD (secretin)